MSSGPRSAHPIEIAGAHGRVILSPVAGASLGSLRVTVGGRHYELLAGGSDDPFAAGVLPFGAGSFLMAPWVNRIRDGRLVAADGIHALPLNCGPHAIHGTAHASLWQVDERGASFAVLSTALSEPWPYRGRMRYRVELAAATLRQTIEVVAAKDEREFPAAVGWHPWFARALTGDDATVRADVTEQWELDATQTPTGVLADTALAHKLRSGGRFAPDEVDGCFRLDAGGAIEVRWPELVLHMRNSAAVTHLMLYSPREALCVEPQTSTVNAFQLAQRGIAGTGTRHVAPGRPLVAWTEWAWG